MSNLTRQNLSWLLNNTSTKCFHTAHQLCKKSGKKMTSQNWMKRQLKDPLVKQARYDNWRCRSAYKLLEIDDKFRLLHPGYTVVDCGAAPGSWTQVAVSKVNANPKEGSKSPSGQVIGIDLLHFAPIQGANILTESDFTEKRTQEKVLELLDGNPVNVVLSDMAPNATGVKSMDHELIIDLCRSALTFGTNVLKQNGTFVCKLWQGSEQKLLENLLNELFESVRLFKPHSSRSESAEIYYVALKYRGVKR